MARKIDYDNLVEDDFQYLADRPWLITEGDYLGHETTAAVNAWRAGEEAEEDDEVIPYEKATVQQLKEALESLGLDTDGKKADLIARLEAHDAENESDESDEDIEEED